MKFNSVNPQEILMVIIRQRGGCLRPFLISCSVCPLSGKGLCSMNGRSDERIIEGRRKKAIEIYTERGYPKEDLVEFLI